MNLLTTNQPLTMSSREIAELTGKQHSHVFRDIRKMLDSLDEEHQEYIQFWTHPQNKQSYAEYVLDRDHTDCLLTGYSAKARMIVIKRWKELEIGAMQTLPNFSDPAQAARAWAEQYEANMIKQHQLELAAPKVAFVDNLVECSNLLTASQVGQKHKMSAVILNRHLTEMNVYNRTIKSCKVFQQWFVDKGYGEMKKTSKGYDQAKFTNAGEIWINEQLHSEGIV